MKILPLDNGYYQTKMYYEAKMNVIASRYTEDIDGDFEYLGKKYTLGQGNYNIDHDKSENELHRLMTYYILSKLTNVQEEFKLVLSLPMLHYKAHKESFKEYIKGNGLIKTKLQGKEKSFNISDVTVFLQGAGALYANNPREYKGRLIGLLDIGGLTAQGAIFEDLKPIPETLFTIDAGGIILNNKIKTKLNQRHGLNIQDYEIPYLQGFEKEIMQVIDEHFSSITLEMKKKNWSLKTLEILATGGASMGMDVNRYLPKCQLTSDPIFDHVKGLNVIGGMIYR